MDNLDYKIIILLKDEKSINKACTKLFMSHQTLSNRIDAIEKELETTLFIRSNKGILFTESGERLYEYATKMLLEYSKMVNFVSGKENQVAGILRLGCSVAFAHTKLPQILADFHKAYPLVEISLTTGLSDFLVKKLYAEELSIAIIKGEHKWYKESFIIQTEPLYLISKEKIELQDLPKLPAIAFKTDITMSHQIDEWWQQNYKENPKYLMYVDSALMCRQLILSGLGWGILPRDRIEDVKDKIFAVPLKHNGLPITRETKLCYKKSPYENDIAMLFANFIKKIFCEVRNEN